MSSIIPVVSADGSPVSPETNIICVGMIYSISSSLKLFTSSSSLSSLVGTGCLAGLNIGPLGKGLLRVSIDMLYVFSTVEITGGVKVSKEAS